MIAKRAIVVKALPGHYNVVSNRTMTKEQIEQFTYHLLYHYFDFTGSIKVPAAVMYAHKIANYARNIAEIPNEDLVDKLKTSERQRVKLSH